MSDLLNHPFFKQKKYLFIFLGGLQFFLFFGYFAFQWFPENNSAAPRSLASIGSSESLLQGNVVVPPNFKRFSKFSKGLSTLRVEINPLQDIPENASDEVVLEATIAVNQTPPNGILNYEWQWDEGVQWLEGNPSGQLFEVKSGDLRTLRVKIRGFSREYSRLVQLSARFDGTESRIGNTALVHSRPEDSFEYIAPVIQMQVDQEKREKARSLASESESEETDFKNTNTPGKLRK
jgi:hypothetical protein